MGIILSGLTFLAATSSYLRRGSKDTASSITTQMVSTTVPGQEAMVRITDLPRLKIEQSQMFSFRPDSMFALKLLSGWPRYLFWLSVHRNPPDEASS